MDQTIIDTISINGKTYYSHPASDPAPTGNRAIIVVDRGWIFAGDVTEPVGHGYGHGDGNGTVTGNSRRRRS